MNEPTAQQKRATQKVIKMLLSCKYTKQEFSEEILDISRPTLDVRLREQNWKKGELLIIESIQV